ncbi:glycosyltransferase family 2 protein [Desulfovibrio sp. OttesenSCG-928-M14]|nr:glycosyltransferase family 2 protein [Desulfovibrio sp. OttesenSCG-928-M14]
MAYLSRPLVSIIIPNYLHSTYLAQSIQSALDQTYKRTQIVVLDNDSEDSSLATAAAFMDRGVTVCKNPFNIFNGSYDLLAGPLTHGKYILMLPADDFIRSSFVERAVDIMERHPNVGYVHGERAFLRGETLLPQDPFYDRSFICPGASVMPIYMMASVAHPAQGLFRREAFYAIGGYDQRIDHVNADRLLWYYLSSVSDYAYLQDEMAVVRVGEQTETAINAANMYHPFGLYLTIQEMVDFARLHGYAAVYERQRPALDKLARELLEFPIRLLAGGNDEDTGRYLAFCRMISPAIASDPRYARLEQMRTRAEVDMDELADMVKDFDHITRKRGYAPPHGYKELEVSHDC